MKNCILAFDVGTSAVKASLVSENLKILAEASQSYETRHPAPQQLVKEAPLRSDNGASGMSLC